MEMGGFFLPLDRYGMHQVGYIITTAVDMDWSFVLLAMEELLSMLITELLVITFSDNSFSSELL